MNSAITICEHPAPLRGDDVLGSHSDGQSRKRDGQRRSPSSSHLAYGVLDIPPWYLCIFLGIQHFLTALGGLVAVPLILAKDLCLQHDPLTQSYLISTIFFVSGICTLLQVLLGVRKYNNSFITAFSVEERETSAYILARLSPFFPLPASDTTSVSPGFFQTPTKDSDSSTIVGTYDVDREDHEGSISTGESVAKVPVGLAF
ncbi:solute carrier family 23 member 1-like [Pteropus alecto]|uniref:solute carrier family 23 member 1-like n=1 Tax=Pteropus alecto TaxID=9402 RepID=UPI000D537E18|nr:solute carrier family 23 member 1-like [Pteropus alecto]